MKTIINSLLQCSMGIFEMCLKATPSDKNMIVSPFSIYNVLSILSLATTKSNKDEMNKALSYKSDLNKLKVDMHKLTEKFKFTLDFGFEREVFEVSNFIFHHDQLKLKDNLINDSKKFYNASIIPIDRENKNGALKKINDTVRLATKDAIPRIVNDLTRDFTALIVNTLYFKGAWRCTFNSSVTRLAEFNSKPNSVRMMNQKNNFFAYDGKDYQSIQMKYVHPGFSFVAIMPQKTTNKEDLLKNLLQNCKNGDLSKLFDQMKEYSVDLSFPKFKSESDINLDSLLEKLGLKKIFKSHESLEIFEKNNSKGLSFKQKVVIKLDEEGTVATSTTSSLQTSGVKEPLDTLKLNFNRSFIYFIVKEIKDKNNSYKLPIFMGFFKGV